MFKFYTDHACILYAGCSSAIIPTMHSIVPIADISIQGSTVTTISIMGTNFSNIHNYLNIVISTFTFEITKELVNSSFCNISTLEVYRGREQAIEISNKGFFFKSQW